MARGYVKKHNLTKDTLLTIAYVGVMVVAASTSPFFLHRLVQAYFRDASKQKARLRAKKLRELERRELISLDELDDGRIRLVLTEHGKTLVRSYTIQDLRLKKPPRWDKKWRVLIYDIPNSQRKAGDAFRQKVKTLGLFPFQKSVWVSPYECFREIELLASLFEIAINKYIYYFHAAEIPREKELKKFFAL